MGKIGFGLTSYEGVIHEHIWIRETEEKAVGVGEGVGQGNGTEEEEFSEGEGIIVEAGFAEVGVDLLDILQGLAIF